MVYRGGWLEPDDRHFKVLCIGKCLSHLLKHPCIIDGFQDGGNDYSSFFSFLCHDLKIGLKWNSGNILKRPGTTGSC